LMALCDRLEAQQADAEAAHTTLVKTLLETLTQSQDADDFATNWQRLSQHFDTIFTTEASLDALKQTLLQLAVMGQLVRQDPNDEPAANLLGRIVTEKSRQIAVGIARRQSPLVADAMGKDLFQLPRSWSWSRIDDVFHVSGGIQKTPARTPKENSHPYVGVGNVYRGYLDLRELGRFEIADG
jgi:type I restriction enzyme, S subunit